ncbi:hypothetical protein E2562_020997 [Oryza meyeriana var. granulata]|uniref:Uncharacterized protein n=1 Tax=Oryza meyeriana var. granulata TaxID=110450 RepID=A0A6G1DYU9_9ORYZ|nr:hypothetical protein E2562_020997 [Oryza meyeriana var. granulata]
MPATNPADPVLAAPLDLAHRYQVNPPTPLDAHRSDALFSLDCQADVVPAKAIKAEELHRPSPPTSAPLCHQPFFASAVPKSRASRRPT